jgi:predicted AAA+ superfamily ATPase
MKTFKRLMEPVILNMSGALPAIAIDGPKAVGKTWIGRNIAQTVWEFDREETRALFKANSAIISESKKPVLIDEWQKTPDVWDTVRRLVDDDSSPEQFLLTGSAYPKGADVHSGAGRIVHARLHPLSLQERFGMKRGLGISEIFTGKLPSGIFANTKILFDDYISEIVRSGFPAIHNADSQARPMLIEGYLDNILTHEANENGYRVRKPNTFRYWLRAFASAVGTESGYTEILDSATPGERHKPAKSTANSYRDTLANLWLLEELDPWLPPEGNFNRLKMTPKHYLTDPALEAALLGIDQNMIMTARVNTGFDAKYGSITGRLFESLVGQSLRTYAAVNGAKLNYFKTLDTAHEVDFILSKGARAIGVEVKLKASVDSTDVKQLNWLAKSYGEDLIAKIVVTTGENAYVREQDGVIVCPAALLCA